MLPHSWELLELRARNETPSGQAKGNEQLRRSGHTENTKILPLYLRQIWLTLVSSAFPWRSPFTTALLSFISPCSSGRDQGLLVSWSWSTYPACADIWHLEYLSKYVYWLQTQSIWQKNTRTSKIIQGNLFLSARVEKNRAEWAYRALFWFWCRVLGSPAFVCMRNMCGEFISVCRETELWKNVLLNELPGKTPISGWVNSHPARWGSHSALLLLSPWSCLTWRGTGGSDAELGHKQMPHSSSQI